MFLISEEFSAQINKKDGKILGKYVNSSHEVFQRYRQCQPESPTVTLHGACFPLSPHLKKQGEGKALWEGEAFTSSKQSWQRRGRKQR